MHTCSWGPSGCVTTERSGQLPWLIKHDSEALDQQVAVSCLKEALGRVAPAIGHYKERPVDLSLHYNQEHTNLSFDQCICLNALSLIYVSLYLKWVFYIRVSGAGGDILSCPLLDSLSCLVFPAMLRTPPRAFCVVLSLVGTIQPNLGPEAEAPPTLFPLLLYAIRLSSGASVTWTWGYLTLSHRTLGLCFFLLKLFSSMAQCG